MVKTITFEGETLSIKEWSRLRGIPRVTIYRRLQSGVVDPVVLLSRERVLSNEIVLTFEGVTLPLAKWAVRVGCSRQALYNRLQRLPLEVALRSRLPGRVYRRRGRCFTVGGVSLTVGEWAERLGCTRQAVYLRLQRFPPEVALRIPYTGWKYRGLQF